LGGPHRWGGSEKGLWEREKKVNTNGLNTLIASERGGVKPRQEQKTEEENKQKTD